MYRTTHSTLQQFSFKSCRIPSIPSPKRILDKTPPTDPYCCYDQRSRYSRRSSYHLSTNFSHQLNIKRIRTQTLNYICPLHLTYIETGSNRRKPPHRIMCVAIDMTAAFDTVSHGTLTSKIARSSLPPAIT